MKRFDFGRSTLGCCAAVAALVGCSESQAQVGAPPLSVRAVNFGAFSGASSENVLYSFTGGNDGGDAATSLVFDRQENLYGTTVVGGTFACGTVFRLSAQASPPWHETVLDNFDCYADGKNPYGGVTLDGKGNLDGTTVAGGSGGSCSDGCGVVFQLRPAVEKVLHSFTGSNDGFGPGAALVLDPAGHLYGTTPDGGAHSEGVVYEVSRGQHGRGTKESYMPLPAEKTEARDRSEVCCFSPAASLASPKPEAPTVRARYLNCRQRQRNDGR